MAADFPHSHAVVRMLERVGVPRDGVLLVHSAFKDFRRDGYDAEEVVAALVDYMAPGTLLLPTMSWRYVKPQSPFFDEIATPSNTGILTELFRARYATRRSLHPTHSVAGRGPLTDEILGTHHLCVTPCGVLSPFGKVAALGGYVVMMGVGFDCCTLLHHVEETTAPDRYCRPVESIETYTCRDRHGQEVTVKLRRHLFLPRDYWQFQDMLAAAGKLTVYRCDNAICRGFAAAELTGMAAAVLRERPDAIIARPGQRYRLM
jgi:aminoglycoside 3-N-acetyltransferase